MIATGLQMVAVKNQVHMFEVGFLIEMIIGPLSKKFSQESERSIFTIFGNKVI